jgi:hypothetical protein
MAETQSQVGFLIAARSDNDPTMVTSLFELCYRAESLKAIFLLGYIQINSYLLLGDFQRLQAVTDNLQFLLQFHDLAARAESRTLESIQCINFAST